MNKRFMVVVLLAVLGCSYSGGRLQGYLDDPKTLLEDPFSVSNQQALDQLESRYLRKEITYAEYVEDKKQLEDDYVKDVNQLKGDRY